MIGAPPGYVGYEEGGHLTEAIRRKPYSLLLLDEIEKAHPDVFNILLQVFDDGRLTDGHGRTVDFRNTVIVMTSNLGSEQIQKMAATSNYDEMRETVLEVVSSHFRPEFINRIDDLVVFHNLQRDQIKDIAKIQVLHVHERLREQDIELEVTEAAMELIANTGFDPVYGARPLKRAIQTQLETPLANEILVGNFTPGSKVIVDKENNSLIFR